VCKFKKEMLSVLDEPVVAPPFELRECEKSVIKAFKYLDDERNADAREELMRGLSNQPDCATALLLMRCIRLDRPSVFGPTDIPPEEMLSRAQKAPSEERERAKKFCAYVAEAYPASPVGLFMCASTLEKVCNKIDEALPLYLRSAELGCAAAQFNIGCFYSSGIGVELDKETAAKWFQLAADQGRANAQNNLGVLYLSGQGVPQDRKKAAELFKAASAQGHAAARQNYLIAVRPQTPLKLPSTTTIPDQPILSPRETDEPWDGNSGSEDVPLTGGGSKKRRWSFSTRFFGGK